MPIHGLLCLQDVVAPAVVERAELERAEAARVRGEDFAQAVRQAPELHVNLWEADEVFLDIGLMIDADELADRILFIVPFSVEGRDLEDLADRFLQQAAVSAIFNQDWIHSRSPDGVQFVSAPQSPGRAKFTIVSTQDSLRAEELQHNGQALQAISLNLAQLRRRSASVASPSMYVRFRIRNVPRDFYRVGIHQKDRLLLSNWKETEIIDFRLNVRRGAPMGLELETGTRYLSFSKVHLFLMKSHEHEIAFEGPLFKACRSLEDEEFWASYSLPKGPSKELLEASTRRVKTSLGYQWTKTAASVPGREAVSEFDILARFSKMRFNFAWFVLLALTLGAFGNGLWDLFCWSAGHLWGALVTIVRAFT